MRNAFAGNQTLVRCRGQFRVGLLFGFLAMYAPFGTAGPGDIYVGGERDQAIVISNVPGDDQFVVLVRAPVPAVVASAALPEARVRGRDGGLVGRAAPYEAMVSAAALETGVDPKLILAVIAAESGYDPTARSPKGAQGLMQLLPATARRYGVTDAYDPQQGILGGARYLSDLLRLFDQDVSLALAAYNAGEQAVERFGRRIPPYRETKAYVPRVLSHYRKLTSRSM